jgi:amino acid adenylation domain-containing protein
MEDKSLDPRQRLLALRLAQARAGERAASAPIAARGLAEAPGSPVQEALWFIDRLLGSGGLYNSSRQWRLVGELDAAALQWSLGELVKRHASLRTRFEERDGVAVQVVQPAASVLLLRVEVTGADAAEREAQLQRRLRECADEGFDLAQGPLLRAQLLKLDDREHVLQVVVHHIVTDGWSMEVLARELGALYGARRAGGESPLVPLPLQFTDYALWQRERLQGARLEGHLAYWREQLRGLEPLELPTDRPRPTSPTYRGAVQRFTVPAEVLEALKALARRHEATLFMVLLAAFKVLLMRYTGQADVAVGTPVAGRDRAELEGLIGYFVNTVVLRTDLSGEPSFEELLGRVRQTALQAYAHQELPFETLVADLSPVRELGRNPLYQVTFQLNNQPEADLRLADLNARTEPLDAALSKFDLSASIAESGGALQGLLEYSTELFDAATMQRLARHFEVLLAGIATQPLDAIGALPLLDAQERHRILIDWNDTARPYPQDLCLHQLFEQQAARTPDAVAIVDEGSGQSISYAQLNVTANQLASYLISSGVCVGNHVAVCLPRSPDVVIAMLAILKAGATYVPMDPEYPVERLRYMLEDCEAKVILTQASLQEMFADTGLQQVLLDRDCDNLARLPARKPAVAIGAEAAAYVIYTSGSTGRPKGVGVLHRGICNHVFWIVEALQVGAADRVLLKTSISFDASLFEIVAALHAGATIVLAAADTERDADQLLKVVQERGITVLQMVPSSLRALLANPSATFADSLRYVICGGEALDRSTAREFQRRHPRVALGNFYGPTESSIDATWRQVDAAILQGSGTVPIGRPIANVRCHVLDARLQPVPVGVPGQLYVGGRGLARGYLNRPELTAQAFIDDPYRSGERLYATGDKARYLSTGELEFLGRLNEQVKVRGYRIELGEIESALGMHEGVARSVVIVREDAPGDARLVAYVVGRDGHSADPASLRQHLATSLPAYMVPQHIVVLESIPLLPNGKTDRKALPQPEMREQEGSYAAPRSELEESLAQIWSEVLGGVRVGVHDSFFDLGGHSLTAMQVVSRIRSTFQVELALRTLFETPTVARQAVAVQALLQSGGSHVDEPIRVQSSRQEWPASQAQKALWFIDRMLGRSRLYIIQMAIRLQGELDAAALQWSLGELVKRHASLRTRFEERDGVAVQVVQPAASVLLLRVEVTGADAAEREAQLQRRLRECADEGFDLAQGPLLRAQLLKLDDREHVLQVVVHHIVTDGWSMEVLARELGALYGARRAGGESPLVPLPLQFTDYALWQRERLQGARLEGHLAYWREQLRGLEPLELPTDRPRPTSPTYRGAVQRFTVPAEVLEALKALARRHEATLFMVLLAAFKVLLMRYTGQADVAVGTPVAGRDRAELEGLIGYFVNTVVLRTDLSGEPSFEELLGRVRQTALQAYAHQELPFETLVADLSPVRELGRNPLYQVTFQLNNQPEADLRLADLNARTEPLDAALSKFDLSASIAESGGALQGLLEYSTELFDAATMQRLARHFEVLLAGIATQPLDAIGALPLLDAQERHRILIDWNDTARPYPQDLCLHQLFEQQAARTPDALAIEYEGATLSYGELNRRANQLARLLRRKGVGPDVLVGVFAERSFEMVLALLAILKAGGAYVPLDPSYPAARLAHMLEDARTPLVVAQPHLAKQLPSQAKEVHLLDPSWAAYADEAAEDLDALCTSQNLAYTIFTSGSTGRSKGAMNEHRAICNRLLWMQEQYSLEADDRVLQKTQFSFDVSVWEFFWPLLAGARLVIARPEGHRDSAYLVKLIRDCAITTLHFVPSMLRAFLEEGGLESCGSLRNVICSGEALPHALQERFFTRLPASKLHNLYGPTEAAVDVTHWACQRGDERLTVPIGRPVANTQMYVLDGRMEPAPVGVAGELYIGGVQVGRGYVSRDDLTVARFVPDPFSRTPDARLYRTGDLARHLPDGVIEYLGRLDYQVKVRGQRIELGEIEATLDQHPAVGQSVLLAREDAPGDQRLVAYVVARQAAPTVAELKAHLLHTLPPYMVPGAFVFLDALPLTSSGKVDRKALPRPERDTRDPNQEFSAPEPGIESVIAGVWSRLLGLERVSARDNFFELGGHSLLVMQAIFQIESESGVRLNPRQFIFESLRQIARSSSSPAKPGIPVAESGLIGRWFRRIRT